MRPPYCAGCGKDVRWRGSAPCCCSTHFITCSTSMPGPTISAMHIFTCRSSTRTPITYQAEALKASHEPVLAAAKALELRTYNRAGVIFTVSSADRALISEAMRPATDKSTDKPVPTIRVVPFATSPVASAAVAPLQSRERGSMLYVGTCHPVAKASVSWLLQLVFPHLKRRAAAIGVQPILRIVGQFAIPLQGWLGSRGLAQTFAPPVALT